jgi:phage N-6-adenine-methyltransferase
MKTVTTSWGTKQLKIDDVPLLSQEAETALRQEWRTERAFWEALNKEFEFDIDVAASKENALKSRYFSEKQDALSDPAIWIDPCEPDTCLRAYCNPGFGDLDPWMKKAARQAALDPSAIVCVLGLCAPSSAWWWDALHEASEVRLLAPRVQFEPPDPRIPRSSNARDNALFIFRGKQRSGLQKPAHIETWRWR